MPNKRVTDASLPDVFNDGDYLTGEDLNQIVTVFKNAINYNKTDIDKVLTSDEDANVAYDETTLYDFDGQEGDYAYLFNPDLLGDGVKLYEMVSGSWTYRTKLSLIDLYERIADTPSILEMQQDINDFMAVVNVAVRGSRIYTDAATPIGVVEGDVWFDPNE